MNAIEAFAKSEMGEITGILMVLVGLFTQLMVSKVILPRLRKENTPESLKQADIMKLVGRLDTLIFCFGGAVLIYLHYR